MLKFLKLKNFRGFKSQNFEFSRLNVFVGPNNSGKSSALSAINLLAQSFLADEPNAGPLILNGRFEQLGTYIDTVNGNRSNTPIEISFGFADRYEVQLAFKYRQQRREIELSSFIFTNGGEHVYSYETTKDGFVVRCGTKELDVHEYSNPSKNEVQAEVLFFGFWPYDRRLFQIGHRINKDKQQEIPEQVRIQFEKADMHLSRARHTLSQIFLNFDSLGPFRDQPQRTYMYTGETARHVGKTGSNCITLLVNDSSKRGSQRNGFIDEVSRWLVATGIAKGLEIKNLTSRHFEICVKGQDGSVHNICDVGFGCSQVLPVIVSGLNLFGRPQKSSRSKNPRRSSARSSTLVVQEPEIHLHPNAQAALGTFFAGISSEDGQLFIETHSDNLVLRLCRHVALGELAEGHVTVFYVRDENGSKKVTTMRPNDDGVFVPDWPGGFFPQRQHESLALAKARLPQKGTSAQLTLDFKYPEET
jgi:predicted ATPase